MAPKFSSKKNNKIIIAIIALVLIIAVIAGMKVYQNEKNKIYSGEGIFYSQRDDNIQLQFNKDKTFSYTVKVDETTSDVANGTWAEKNNEITLTYESGNTYTFVKTSDGYIYRKDKIFEGKTNDDKLWNRGFAYKEDGKAVEHLWFMNDGTVECENSSGTIEYRGTYIRVDDIITVRYATKPDSYGKKVQMVDRYLVLENGITNEIFGKTPAENIAK